MIPIQPVTIVSSGGTPMQLCDQKGAPYPTTGFGALVYNTGPTLIEAILIDPHMTFNVIKVDAGTFFNPSIQFTNDDSKTPGFYSTGPGNISVVGTNGNESSRALLASFDHPGNLTITQYAHAGGTIAPADDSTTLATTHWVNQAILAGIGAPSGPAGGDLSGTYPNPTIKLDVGLQGDPTRVVVVPVGTNNQTLATTKFVKDQGYLTAASAGTTYLPLAGGTLTGGLTGTTATFNAGPVIVDRTGDAAQGVFDARVDAAQNAGMIMRTGALTRWQVVKQGTAEGGSNAGSNFVIAAYDDAGAALSTPVTIIRSTGAVTLSGALTGTTATMASAGQATANVDTSLGANFYARDTGALSNNGGMVLFGASQGAFAAIKGLILNGSSNTAGDLVVATRRVNTDATLSETARFFGGGGMTVQGLVAASASSRAYTATAIPAGGTAGAGFTFSSTANFGTIFGSGAPTASMARGSLYLRSDGSPYVNLNGTTTWGQLALTTDVPTTLPPSGVAGGDLSGTYPNPLLKPSVNNTWVMTTVAGVAAWAAPAGGGGGGSVTAVSVVSANGLAGTVANASTTPAITLSTTVTGLLKGNGTAISAGVAGTDYVTPGGLTTALGSYLPLAGGTLTGGLIGTTATFSGAVGVGGAVGVAKLRSQGADNDLLGLFSGTTKGLRITTTVNGAVIQGVDTTGIGSFQPLELFGTVVNAPTPTAGANDSQIATTAFVQSALPTSLPGPPTGTAGGDLSGTYPNPTIKPSVTNGQVLTTVAGVAAWAASGGGGASVTVSDTAPGSPTSGALWWNSTLGVMFIWYTDPNTSQWVPVTPTVSGAGSFLSLSGGTLTGPLTGTTATMSGTVTTNHLTVIAPAAAVIELNDTDTAVKKFLINDNGTFYVANSAFSAYVFGVSDTGAITATGPLTGTTATFTGVVSTNGFTAGYLEVPQNAQTGSYTAVLADSGKHLYHAVAAAAATYTIPSNASVAYPLGATLTFVNDSANAVTIAITTDTLVLSPGTTTGSRTLATGGVATAIKVTATRWIINGTGLT